MFPHLFPLALLKLLSFLLIKGSLFHYRLALVKKNSCIIFIFLTRDKQVVKITVMAPEF